MNGKLRSLLKEHDLRVTSIRLEILDYLRSRDSAVSQAQLESEFETTADRVTIYRTLNSFLEKGIVHKVLTEQGGSQYALCQDCSEETHSDNHVHFKCDVCGETVCLYHVEIPDVKLPKGFNLRTSNLLLQGTCEKCIN